MSTKVKLVPSFPETSFQCGFRLIVLGFLLLVAGCKDSIPTDPDPEPQVIAVSIEGFVSQEGDQNPIEGGRVAVSQEGESEALDETTTDEAGSYTLSFTVLETEAPDELHLEVKADGYIGYEQVISFRPDIEYDITLAAVEMEATASGTVTKANSGDPVEGATIEGRSEEGDQLFDASTNAEGHYEVTFGLAEEPEEIRIVAEAEGYVTAKKTLDFGEEIIADFTLKAASTEATASGTVTDESSEEGVSSAAVIAVDADTGDQLFETSTDGDGEYETSFEVDDEPDEVTVTAEAEGYESADETVDFAEEMTVHFELSAETTQATASGTVSRADTGDPIEGATVTGTSPDGDDSLFEVETDAEGDYQASFEVRIVDKTEDITVEAEADDFDSAHETVSFEETIAVDLTLEPEQLNVIIDGQVTAEQDESAVEGADVSVSHIDEEANPLASVTSQSGGSYELSFEVLALDAPEKVRIEVEDRRFQAKEVTVNFDISITRDISLQSITISAIEELQKIGRYSDYPIDGYYIQTQDIDASETENWNGGAGFGPIGDDIVPFSGNYDGGNFTVAGLIIDRLDESRVGLFGIVEEGGALRNVTLENTEVGGRSSVGGLVGNNSGVIYNSEITGEITGERTSIGGLAGFNSGEIEYSKSFGIINGHNNTGGLVGSNSGDISNSEGNNHVRGGETIGGLTGNNSGRIHTSRATGKVEGHIVGYGYDATGGLVGRNVRGGAIHNSESTGDVSGKWGVGGLVGENRSSIQESIATGDTEGIREVGGLVGANMLEAVIQDSKATGEISSEEGAAGGLVGGNRSDASVISSTATGVVSSIESVGGLVGHNRGDVRSSSASGNAVGEGNESEFVGGLVGKNNAGNIINSYALGAATGHEYIGGLIGGNTDSGHVSESYAVGSVSGNVDVGGLTGVNGADVNYSYWDIDNTGQDEGVGRGSFDGVTGLTTEEMQGEAAKEYLEGFDFEVVWETVTGDYPILWWEGI